MEFIVREQVRIVSFGGGVQSHALLCLAAQGKLNDDQGRPFKDFVFANVGPNSESPHTIAYMEEYTYAYAEQHGLRLHETKHWTADDNGNPVADPKVHSRRELYGRIMEAGPKGGQFVGIPVKIGEKGIASRNCTQDYKVNSIVAWCRDHGATLDYPALTAIGISMDEFQRAKNTETPYQKIVYPLIERRFTRANCLYIIEQAGLPRPPKSSCYFCPYHSKKTWAILKRDDRELFDKTVEMERVMTQRRAERGYGPVYFHDRRKPLDQAVRDEDCTSTDVEDICESGYCHI